MKTRRGAESQRRHRGQRCTSEKTGARLQAQRAAAHAAQFEGTFVRRSRVAKRGNERHRARYL